jgi:8-oxo-dGTP diphosphatase
MTRRLHRTARCILARHGSVLVMQAAQSPRTGLPGGHIDPGEQAIDALIREIREELGPELQLIRWLAKIENDWETALVHESMDLYEAETWPLNAPLRAREAHLTALWVPWYQVEAVNLMPRQVYPWIARIGGRP